MKAFISAFLASLAIAAPAMAAPLPADHQRFVDTMVNDGVIFKVNEPAELCYGDKDVDGGYVVYKGDRYLVVCQDNRTTSDVTNWTANDLDTIRHEGFHVIQDCMSGAKNDNVFDTVFTSQEEVIDALGVEEAMRITSIYSNNYNKDRHGDIKMEIEAFYAARDYSATELNSLYTQYCK
ncbi:hypothetical protein BOW86_gp079 [Synechococcus phage S-CAM7]|uniref:Uncharacterized protein n=1 Tax=Synechococcus phage S-CAM7 TaxID=1883368 RepID=A0A1D8KUK9_9CAUD|nr:hypothetical protein BOW86_gp079 [Synechococcus phage S-CAM7]AOV62003.1 hypothetical protein C490910_079 [Synechococcus phage S-CAM7]AOV62267.1 hypothetical protein S420910_078 [Synechococcus phage S-CAM7]QLF86135.1 hypothetical protein CC030809_00079 [Synechococcus phage S-CAM7]